MKNPFLPLSPRNSFNRVRIAALPGITPDVDVLGKTAYDIVSKQALIGLIQPHRAALGLADSDDDDLPRRFDACYTAGDPAVRQTAEIIGRTFGRGLGYVLLALKRGDAANRAARPDWDDRHWAFWGQLERFQLGGGLAAGQTGVRLARWGAAVLAGHGFPDVTITRSPYGAALPMLGAARRLRLSNGAALVFDFGQTAVKRGWIEVNGGMISALHNLSGIAAPCGSSPQTDRAALDRLVLDMVDIIVLTQEQVATCGIQLAPAISASLAVYIEGGHIADTERGCYAALGLLADDVETLLAERLAERLGYVVELRLMHDGTAGAAIYAGESRTAALIIGTAVGVGFPPPPDGLLPLAEPVALDEALPDQ